MKELPCPPAQWPRFSALLDLALDLPEAERLAFLQGLSGEDAALRAGLERVLGCDGTRSTADFLRATALELIEESFAAGQLVGPYRLEAKLGEGGMGEVWRASRHDEGPQREVALKLPHALLLSGRTRRRFALERDMLASLCHPHIAQLYDAGSDADGNPYLALELVQGVPITVYCRMASASLERRADLLLQVLQGLSYAHARLIVHRDIKPTNVLVTAEGNAKILDFGIAKLLSGDTTKAAVTQALTRMATPAYASPEQLAGEEITVATDVFSAGVVMFELCVGALPFTRLRQIADEAPLASARAMEEASSAGERAAARRLRGDLDAIIAKAIAVRPEDRYNSAEAFAADLRRWRVNLPVRARRIGWGTAARKFLRRNRTGAALAAVLLVAVSLGTGGVAWQARRAEAEAARAEAAAKRATAIKDFLIGLFKQGNPNHGGRADQDMTARELLDLGAKRAETAFAGDPATEAELQQMLAEMYTMDEDIPPALHAYARRLALTRAAYGPTDSRAIDALMDLAWQYGEVGRASDGLSLMVPMRTALRARYGDASLQWAEWLDVHGGLLAFVPRQQQQSLAEAQRAVDILQAHFRGKREYVDALFSLLHSQFLNERFTEALQTAEQAKAAAVALQDFEGLDLVVYHRDKGHVLERLGRADAAAVDYATALALALNMAGKRRDFAIIQNMRAHAAEMGGARVTAASLFSQSAEPERLAEKHGADALPPHDLADALVREGRAAEAVVLLLRMIAQLGHEQQNWPSAGRARELQGLLGDAYDQLGQVSIARVLLREARDLSLRDGLAGGAEVRLARVRWARFQLEHGDVDNAAAEFAAVRAQVVVDEAGALAEAGLARVAVRQGNAHGAVAHGGAASALLGAVTQEIDVRSWLEIWLARAESARAAGDPAEAVRWAGRALAAASHWCVAGNVWSARARALLAAASSAPAPQVPAAREPATR